MIDGSLTPAEAEAHGYQQCRVLPDGRTIGVADFIFTTGLVVGITKHSYDHRYCYPNREGAVAALKAWDGHGHPPGDWIKRKGLHPEISNPAFAGIPIVCESTTENSHG